MPAQRRPVGAKRQEIIRVSTEMFGRHGYEDTKWADVATAVGVGPTALYHYFESKQHCLYEIMDEAIEDFHGRFVAITARESDPVRAMEQVLNSGKVTADLHPTGTPATTEQTGEAVCQAI